MSQVLLHNEIKTWRGHLNLYQNKLDKILNTPDDTDNGDFVEVDLRFLDNKKLKTKSFPTAPEKKIINKESFI